MKNKMTPIDLRIRMAQRLSQCQKEAKAAGLDDITFVGELIDIAADIHIAYVCHLGADVHDPGIKETWMRMFDDAHKAHVHLAKHEGGLKGG